MTTQSTSQESKLLKSWEISPKEVKHTQSAWIVVALTLLAIILGLVIKNSVETATVGYEHSGVSARVPERWQVKNGFGNEDPLVFSANNPLDATLSYSVFLLPSGANIKLEDLASNHNIERARLLDGYRVLDQQQVQVAGQDAYKVHYVFVNPGNPMQLLAVMEGVDYYFATQPKALMMSMEDHTDLFDGALPAFLRFVDSVKLTTGGE